MSFDKRTLIIGDLSGIQEYLFDVANEGGQQARRLRARSFFIQLAAECMALRILKAAGCSQQQLLFCGAGKFIIEAASISEEQRQALELEQQRLTTWLLEETNAQLRLAITVSESGDSPQTSYEQALQSLQQKKLRAWANASSDKENWHGGWLILKPLDKPCDLCGRRKADIRKVVCRRCFEDHQIGKALPRTNWIVLSESGLSKFHFPGWYVALQPERPITKNEWLLHLTNSESVAGPAEPKVIQRALARHIPRGAYDRPIEFGELAKKAEGDHLLAVLKADADSLGEYFNQRLTGADDFSPLKLASREMDAFFGVTLDREISKSNWDDIYTIFAGGDDLLLVGPWNVIFDFASRANQMFNEKFGKHGLTLSAGMTFLKPKQPIKRAVEQAEDLLHRAKTRAAPQASHPKNQFAAFGQIWKWEHHELISAQGKQLAEWVNAGIAERGWLQTLLRLAEWRQVKEDPEASSIERMLSSMATARLAYFVARNFLKEKDRDPEKQKLRQWANGLIADFDNAKNPETIYLPTIVRYAMTATRKINSEG